jgi:hypothetical protein
MKDRDNDVLVENKMNVRQAVKQALFFGGTALAGGLMLTGQAFAQDDAEELE